MVYGLIQALFQLPREGICDSFSMVHVYISQILGSIKGVGDKSGPFVWLEVGSSTELPGHLAVPFSGD